MLNWLKSSYSTADGPDCVEVANAGETVLIRDSKDPSGVPVSVGPEAWGAFIGAITRPNGARPGTP
ncbi:DUF397 domain-containing protein [Streptomyces niger]|uniref:DUF397 domain-containing protein n=1 Tax=Streptomyces niger TaxID=66373 RepID=UPI000AEA3505|nr:DUF397 domain-containing protein [Streptomyces niger]